MKISLLAIVLLLGTVVHAQFNCPAFGHEEELHTNHQKVNFTSAGTMFHTSDNEINHHIPYVHGDHPIGTVYAAATWISGRDAGGNLSVIAPTYLANQGEGYHHGPIDALSSVPVATNCQEFNHIWRVSRWAVERLITDFNDNGVIDNAVEPELLQWPGRGNPHFATQMGYPLPNQDLAPFYDQNNDGIYNPLDGDYPVYKMGIQTAIAEQVLWNVFHTFQDTAVNISTLDLKLEIQQTAYALDCGSNAILHQTFFVHHKVISRAPMTHYDVRYGNWNDFDLGCNVDDYVGSIPNKNTIYAYNADQNDDPICGNFGLLGYGTNPPVQAVTFLNQTMTGAIYYISGGGPTGDPQSSIQYDRLLSGLFIGGSPMTATGNGYNPTSTLAPTSFMFPDNPNSGTGWSMATNNLSGLDQRTLGTIYKDTLLPGEVWDIELAYSFHRDTTLSAWGNVNLMEEQIDSLQQYYDNGLHNLTCPIVSNCVANCVFPGDANNNGVANDFDILEMGLFYGQTAIQRANIGDRWSPYNPPTPIANAYVDADGMGQVDTLDLEANSQNWMLTHSLYTGAQEGSNAVGDDLFFARIGFLPLLPFDTVVLLGNAIKLQVHLGDSSNLLNAQGLTYRVRYDEDLLDYNQRQYGGNLGYGGWLREDGADVFHREIEGYGLIHVVTSRLDYGDYGGQGLLDLLDFRVNPNAVMTADTMYTQICFEDFRAVNATGRELSIGAKCITIPYTNTLFNSVRTLPTAPAIRLYPNPAKEAIQVDLGTASAKQIDVLDLLGQTVQQYQHVQEQLTIPKGQLPTGMYVVRVSFENGSQSTHKIIFQ